MFQNKKGFLNLIFFVYLLNRFWYVIWWLYFVSQGRGKLYSTELQGGRKLLNYLRCEDDDDDEWLVEAEAGRLADPTISNQNTKSNIKYKIGLFNYQRDLRRTFSELDQTFSEKYGMHYMFHPCSNPFVTAGRFFDTFFDFFFLIKFECMPHC